MNKEEKDSIQCNSFYLSTKFEIHQIRESPKVCAIPLKNPAMIRSWRAENPMDPRELTVGIRNEEESPMERGEGGGETAL